MAAPERLRRIKLKKQKLFINFLNNNISLVTNNDAYGLFLRKYFFPLNCDIEPINCNISIDILWDYGNWKQITDKVMWKNNLRFLEMHFA